MAIKTKLANKPLQNEDGTITATLVAIETIDASESEFDQEQLKFTFEVPGKIRPINMSFWTGTMINPDKYVSASGSKPEYNKLTKVLLALEVFTEAELKDITEELNDELGEKLESLVGTQVSYTLTKSSKLKTLPQIDLSSLKPLTT